MCFLRGMEWILDSIWFGSYPSYRPHFHTALIRRTRRRSLQFLQENGAVRSNKASVTSAVTLRFPVNSSIPPTPLWTPRRKVSGYVSLTRTDSVSATEQFGRTDRRQISWERRDAGPCCPQPSPIWFSLVPSIRDCSTTV
jgi:hypothetical protein